MAAVSPALRCGFAFALLGAAACQAGSAAGEKTVLLWPQGAPGAAGDGERDRPAVTAATPPAFLAHAVTDGSVPVANSEMFHAALLAHGVPSEFLRLPEGAHGLGCGGGRLWVQWQAACLEWMKARGIVGK
jgi:acetyl esterase/lipase